jgi:hypothetical protein
MMQRIVPVAIAAAAPLVLIATFALGSAPDEEELRWGILSSFLHVRGLLSGDLLTWTSALGFGMPHPMVPNYNVHPLTPLLAIIAPTTWVRLLYIAHTLVGALGMWRLTATLGIVAIVRAACVFTFLLATPTQNYGLMDFWPSHYLMWTSSPWLLLLAWRFLDAGEPQVRRVSVLLGLCAGIVLATTHPGHVPVYGTVVVGIVLMRGRALAGRWRWALLALGITIAIAAPNLLQLARERSVFDPDLGVVKFNEPVPPSAAWDLFVRPFGLTGQSWQDAVVAAGVRVPFFGGPFAALAIAGIVLLRWTRLDLRLTAVLSACLLFTPALELTFLSRYHFRDPMLLSAIPLAGVMLDRYLAEPRTRTLAWTALAIQLAVVGAAAFPYVQGMWFPESREAMWLRGATAAQPVADRLLRLIEGDGRVVYSSQVDFEVAQFGRLPDGLGVNALAYRGASVVNGSFKGISTDALWPDDRLFYGRLRVPPHQIESDAALDLLGIRYVVAKPGEAVAPGLRPLTTMHDAYRSPLIVYGNPDAGPGAFVLDYAMGEPPALPQYAECSNTRLLCRDFTPLAALQRPVALTRSDGRMSAVVPASESRQLLIVAEMYRPEWTAASGSGRLPTISIGPGLLGVVVPGGVSVIELTHRDPVLVAATVASWLALAAGVLAMGILARRSRIGALE